MSDKVFNAICITVIVLVICAFVYAIFFEGNTAIPVSGCVIDKIQVANGYSEPVHVLELSTGQYITTSTRVYFAAIVGGCYDFDGPRRGTSYNSIKEKVRE